MSVLTCVLVLQWVMDALVCNALGIYLGMKTVKYLSMKTYHWRGMWNIPTYRSVHFVITNTSPGDVSLMVSGKLCLLLENELLIMEVLYNNCGMKEKKYKPFYHKVTKGPLGSVQILLVL